MNQNEKKKCRMKLIKLIAFINVIKLIAFINVIKGANSIDPISSHLIKSNEIL